MAATRPLPWKEAHQVYSELVTCRRNGRLSCAGMCPAQPPTEEDDMTATINPTTGAPILPIDLTAENLLEGLTLEQRVALYAAIGATLPVVDPRDTHVERLAEALASLVSAATTCQQAARAVLAAETAGEREEAHL